MQISQLTGVSSESAELAVSDTYLRTLNKAGTDQASQTLFSFEAEATANPATLNKVGDLAKLYDSGYEEVAYKASDSIADKLSAGADRKAALDETYVPNAVSLKADQVVKSLDNPRVPGDEQQSPLSGPQQPTKDPNLIENPQEDPNLFQLSSPTDKEQTEQTNNDDDGLSVSSSSFAGGTTEGGSLSSDTDDGTTPPNTGETASLKAAGGLSATDDGTTGADPDTDTDTGDGVAALDLGSGGDTSSDGDSSDSSGSDSGDSSDSSDSSGDSGDGDDGGDDDCGDGDGGDSGGGGDSG